MSDTFTNDNRNQKSFKIKTKNTRLNKIIVICKNKKKTKQEIDAQVTIVLKTQYSNKNLIFLILTVLLKGIDSFYLIIIENSG